MDYSSTTRGAAGFTAALKYYLAILLPTTPMGFPWKREKSDSRQKCNSSKYLNNALYVSLYIDHGRSVNEG